MLKPTIAVTAVLLAGCAGAGVLQRGVSRTGVTGSPQMLVSQLAVVFDAYHIPVGPQGRTFVTSRPFDPAEIWTVEDELGRVECKEPKKPKHSTSRHLMTLTVRAGVYGPPSITHAGGRIQTPTYSDASTIYISSGGSRADGAHCKLTDDFEQQMLARVTDLRRSVMNGPNSQ